MNMIDSVLIQLISCGDKVVSDWNFRAWTHIPRVAQDGWKVRLYILTCPGVKRCLCTLSGPHLKTPFYYSSRSVPSNRCSVLPHGKSWGVGEGRKLMKMKYPGEWKTQNYSGFEKSIAMSLRPKIKDTLMFGAKRKSCMEMLSTLRLPFVQVDDCFPLQDIIFSLFQKHSLKEFHLVRNVMNKWKECISHRTFLFP